ncbi:MAG: sugar phosphate nucleotidyltransferase [Gemmatimonadales bacterium]
MILAAGAGTRLRPLTDRVPKALIEVAGRPLLAHVMDRLVGVGARHLIINTHYHEDQIRDFLRVCPLQDLDISVSSEPGGPYDTGGGLFAAAKFFTRGGPFLLHNVDVLSRIPLDDLVREHRSAGLSSERPLVASLAVQHRETSRQLLFDAQGLLGWENRAPDGTLSDSQRVRDPAGAVTHWSFTGIHVLEPTVFDLSDRAGTFSIIALYLELARQGYSIHAVDMSAHEWIDVGTPTRLEEARARWRQ